MSKHSRYILVFLVVTAVAVLMAFIYINRDNSYITPALSGGHTPRWSVIIKNNPDYFYGYVKEEIRTTDTVEMVCTFSNGYSTKGKIKYAEPDQGFIFLIGRSDSKTLIDKIELGRNRIFESVNIHSVESNDLYTFRTVVGN